MGGPLGHTLKILGGAQLDFHRDRCAPQECWGYVIAQFLTSWLPLGTVTICATNKVCVLRTMLRAVCSHWQVPAIWQHLQVQHVLPAGRYGASVVELGSFKMLSCYYIYGTLCKHWKHKTNHITDDDVCGAGQVYDSTEIRSLLNTEGTLTEPDTIPGFKDLLGRRSLLFNTGAKHTQQRRILAQARH